MVFTEWEKHLPFIEYEVIIGRAVLHSDLLGSRLKAISQEWSRALKILLGI